MAAYVTQLNFYNDATLQQETIPVHVFQSEIEIPVQRLLNVNETKDELLIRVC